MTWAEEEDNKRFQRIVLFIMIALGVGIIIGWAGSEMNHNDHLAKITFPNGTTIVREEWRR